MKWGNWKKVLLAAIAVGASMLGYMATWARLAIRLERTSLALDNHAIPRDGLRILHLTDLHLYGRGWLERRKIEKTVCLLQHEQVDLIVVTGDFIEEDAGIEAACRLLQRLPPARITTLACLGNHDYAQYGLVGVVVQAAQRAEGDKLQAAVRKARELFNGLRKDERLVLTIAHNDVPRLVRALNQQGVRVFCNDNGWINADIWVAGIDDLMNGTPDSEATMTGMPQHGLRILLAHHPDALLEEACQQVDVALCGHVHGGQIRLPLLGAPYTQGARLPRRRTSGWFRFGRTHTYVSRGWGESTPLRFNCPPEITLITLTRNS
jgi:predicted MPP superfamily phosphohydrolase